MTTFTGNKIKLFQLLSIRGRLKLEIQGMKSRANTLAACKKWGFGGRTRKQALDWVEKMIKQERRADE